MIVMKNILMSVFTILFLNNVFSQKIEYTPVNSVYPTDTDFTDLQFLKPVLKDKKIVAIGDNVHGDALGNLAKIWLIKFLHQEMGFNVLLFESGCYSVRKAWGDTARYKQAVQHRYYGVFAYCKEMEPLWNYIDSLKHTANPLITEGFDLQNFNFTELETELKQIISDTTIEIDKIDVYWKVVRDSLMGGSHICQQKNVTAEKLIAVFKQCLQDSVIQQSKYHTFVVNNIIQYIRSLLMGEGSVQGRDFRDSIMAGNIQFIIENFYPNEKVIVWASNGHIIKSFSGLRFMRFFNKPMGQYLNETYGNKMFVILYTAGKGTSTFTCTNDKYVIRPRRKSLEGQLNRQNANYAFVFTDTLPEKISFFGDNYTVYPHIDLTKYGDAVFYIRQMYGCTCILKQE